MTSSSKSVIKDSGLSIYDFAKRLNVTTTYVLKLCRNGRINGAVRNESTNNLWRIYPPAKIIDET